MKKKYLKLIFSPNVMNVIFKTFLYDSFYARNHWTCGLLGGFLSWKYNVKHIVFSGTLQKNSLTELSTRIVFLITSKIFEVKGKIESVCNFYFSYHKSYWLMGYLLVVSSLKATCEFLFSHYHSRCYGNAVWEIAVTF